MKRSLIIQYINLLHKYGDPEALKVRKFVSKHLDDKDFIRRIHVVQTIFTLTKELITDGLLQVV